MLDYLFLYEVTVRELESITLLGNELMRRGFSVDYLSFDDINLYKYTNNKRRIRKYFNKVNTVIMPSLYHSKELINLVYYVCGRAVNVVNIRWEQYATNKDMENLNAFFFPVGEAKKAYHVCWGEESYNSLKIRGVQSEKLLLTGAIQLDFVRKDFSNFYLDRETLFEKYNFHKTQKVYLFISSFVNATLTDRQFKSIEKDFDGSFKRDFSEIEMSVYSYYEILKWFDLFLSSNNDVIIVYRPHPNENITNDLEELSRRHDNFKIISDFSVKQWILTCDKILTWISTSLAEIYFAKKPCIVLRPFEISHDNDILMYENCTSIKTYDEFCLIKFDTKDTCLSDEILNRCYSFDIIPSYLRLANKLVEIKTANNQFEWDDDLIRNFEKKRFLFWLRSIFFDTYMLIIKLLYLLNKKLKMKIPKKLKIRVDNYGLYLKRKKYDYLNNNIENIKIKTRKIIEENSELYNEENKNTF